MNYIKDLNGNIVNLGSLHEYPLGIAWDGSVFWIGDGNGVFRGYQIEDDVLTLVGSFDGPASNYSSITFDGSSFLVSELGSTTMEHWIRWNNL